MSQEIILEENIQTDMDIKEITGGLEIDQNLLPTDDDPFGDVNLQKLPDLYQRIEHFELKDITAPYKYNSRRQKAIWKIMNSSLDQYMKYYQLNHIHNQEEVKKKKEAEFAKRKIARLKRKRKSR